MQKEHWETKAYWVVFAKMIGMPLCVFFAVCAAIVHHYDAEAIRAIGMLGMMAFPLVAAFSFFVLSPRWALFVSVVYGSTMGSMSGYGY